MITEDYVSFETAKLLKENGFDVYVRSFYDADDMSAQHNEALWNWNLNKENYRFSAPTIQMTMKWLREMHNRYVEICIDKAHNFKDIVFRPAIYDKSLDCLWESDNFPTYEEACEAAIKYCLENLI